MLELIIVVMLLIMERVFTTTVEIQTTMIKVMNLETPMEILADYIIATVAGVVATTQMYSTLICVVPVAVVNHLMAVMMAMTAMTAMTATMVTMAMTAMKTSKK